MSPKRIFIAAALLSLFAPIASASSGDWILVKGNVRFFDGRRYSGSGPVGVWKGARGVKVAAMTSETTGAGAGFTDSNGDFEFWAHTTDPRSESRIQLWILLAGERWSVHYPGGPGYTFEADSRFAETGILDFGVQYIPHQSAAERALWVHQTAQDCFDFVEVNGGADRIWPDHVTLEYPSSHPCGTCAPFGTVHVSGRSPDDAAASWVVAHELGHQMLWQLYGPHAHPIYSYPELDPFVEEGTLHEIDSEEWNFAALHEGFASTFAHCVFNLEGSQELYSLESFCDADGFGTRNERNVAGVLLDIIDRSNEGPVQGSRRREDSCHARPGENISLNFTSVYWAFEVTSWKVEETVQSGQYVFDELSILDIVKALEEEYPAYYSSRDWSDLLENNHIHSGARR